MIMIVPAGRSLQANTPRPLPGITDTSTSGVSPLCIATAVQLQTRKKEHANPFAEHLAVSSHHRERAGLWTEGEGGGGGTERIEKSCQQRTVRFHRSSLLVAAIHSTRSCCVCSSGPMVMQHLSSKQQGRDFAKPSPIFATS